MKIWKSHICYGCGKRHPQFQMESIKFPNGSIYGWLCKKCYLSLKSVGKAPDMISHTTPAPKNVVAPLTVSRKPILTREVNP